MSSDSVHVLGSGAAWIDISGTIATGATAQDLSQHNPARIGFWIQNQSAGDLYLNFGATATAGQPSLKIASGAYWEAPQSGVPTQRISIYGATTAQAFAAREW